MHPELNEDNMYKPLAAWILMDARVQQPVGNMRSYIYLWSGRSITIIIRSPLKDVGGGISVGDWNKILVALIERSTEIGRRYD